MINVSGEPETLSIDQMSATDNYEVVFKTKQPSSPQIVLKLQRKLHIYEIRYIFMRKYFLRQI